MRKILWTALTAVLLFPRPTPAADYSALLPDDYDRIYAVSGRDRNGAISVLTIKLTYNKQEKLKDMAAQKAKEKARYTYGDYKLVGEPTKKQNCAGLVTDRLGPADLSRPFIAQADDLFTILKTFGERVTVLKNGDVAVWTQDGTKAGHVGVVIGRSEIALKPVILTKDNEEGTYEFTLGRMPIGWESWNPFSVAFADDLDPLVKAYGAAQFWRCDLRALHWEEITFFGPWAEEGGGAAVEGIPERGSAESFVLKRIVPDGASKACELVGRFTTVPVRPGNDGVVRKARGKMACRSSLASREQCGEMAQWVDAEAWLELVTDGTGKARVVLHTSTACPSFTPCRWEVGAAQPRRGRYVHLAPGSAPPPCPADQKSGGKPLLFLREKTFETFDPATKEFKPGREGKGPNSWWRMDERSFHQEHNTGMIVDASWDPVPEALAPLQKYPFTVRAKVSGPGVVEFGVYPVMDTGSWSVTLKESSVKVKHPALNVWVMRIGTEEGQPAVPEGTMTLELQVAGTSKKIDLTNAALDGATGDLAGVTDLFLTLNCMVRGQLTWGWSKAQ